MNPQPIHDMLSGNLRLAVLALLALTGLAVLQAALVNGVPVGLQIHCPCIKPPGCEILIHITKPKSTCTAVKYRLKP